MTTSSSKKRSRKLLIWMVILLAALGGGGWYYYAQKREKPTEVQVAKVTRRNLTELVTANGRIFPVTQVKISPEVSGEIIELPLKEGQAVKKGDLLLKIKPDYYLASKRSAQASYQSSIAAKNQAAASLEKAEIELKRNERLFRDSLITESAFQELQTARSIALAAFQSATHQIDVANAALARADEDLAKTTIYSPINGTVSKLNSQLGERVVGTAMMTGTEVMVVADLTAMEARVDVGEMDVVLMKLGLKARLEVDAFPDRKFSGHVTQVANSSKNSQLTASTGGSSGQQDATRFEVRVRIDENEYFRPGMTITAEIETQYRTNVLTIPIQCVTTRLAPTNSASSNTTQASGGSGSSSQKAEGKKETQKAIEVVFLRENDLAKSVPVTRGVSDDSYVEILTGLKEDQEVISGSYKAISRDLKDGSKVVLAKPSTKDKEKERETKPSP